MSLLFPFYQSKFGSCLLQSLPQAFMNSVVLPGALGQPLAPLPIRGAWSLLSRFNCVAAGSLCLVRFVLFWFLRHDAEMINTCFHIPTCMIYCVKLAGLQALLPSSCLSWHLYSAVFTFLSLYPYCKILFVLYVDEIKKKIKHVGSHTSCYGGYRSAKTHFSGIRAGCWLTFKVKGNEPELLI